MKNRLLLFMAGCCALLLSSCLDSDSDVEYKLSKDCEITSFSLSNDSIPALGKVKFTIDQVKGRIFNMDSLPYGTLLDEKLVCALSFAGTVVECKIMQEAKGDTILWDDVDSLDFSKPVKFVTKLWDGQTTKGYLAQVNIHQVVPDSMEWSCYTKDIVSTPLKNEKVLTFKRDSGEELFYMFVEPMRPDEPYALYCSSVTDGKKWTKHEVSGLPLGKIIIPQMIVFKKHIYAISTSGVLYVSSDGMEWTVVENSPVLKALLGVIDTENELISTKQASVLSVIAEKEGIKYFSCLTSEGNWLPEVQNDVNPIPQKFPIKGFANISFNAMYCARLSLIGGEMQNGQVTNKTWGTTDGLKWENLSISENSTPFRGIEGASIVEYDNIRGEQNKFFMLGGFDENGKASSKIYRSSDGGMSWAVSDTLVLMPNTFKPRGEMSIYVSKDNFIHLFGGKEQKNTEVIDEIWRGRINRLGFDFVPLN